MDRIVLDGVELSATDETLTVSGKAADAGAVGDALSDVINITDKLQRDVVSIKAQTIQQAPLFANDIGECTDTSKVYMLPDGYYYGYQAIRMTTSENMFDASTAKANTRLNTDGAEIDANGYSVSDYIPVDLSAADSFAIRIYPYSIQVSQRYHAYNADRELLGIVYLPPNKAWSPVEDKVLTIDLYDTNEIPHDLLKTVKYLRFTLAGTISSLIVEFTVNDRYENIYEWRSTGQRFLTGENIEGTITILNNIEFVDDDAAFEDTTKAYVLPDKSVWAWKKQTNAAYTNLADPDSDQWVTDMRFTTSGEAEQVGMIQTNAIPAKPGDIVYVKGFDIYSQSGPLPRFAAYKNGVHVELEDYSDTKSSIDRGFGTKSDDLTYFTLRLVRTTGEAHPDFDSIRLGGRICTGYTKDNVIITVNEPIEASEEYAWCNTGITFAPAEYEDRIIDLEEQAASIEKRLSKLESQDEVLKNIPGYWTEELEAKALAIREAAGNAGRNKSAFLWFTDAHVTSGSALVSPYLLKYLQENTPIKKVNFGGDLVGDPERLTQEYLNDIYDFRKKLARLSNLHSVIGNHDNVHKGRNDSEISNLVYSFLLAPEESTDMVVGGDFYYYIDNPSEKTRYLYLDSGRFSIDDEETHFVINALKSLQMDWHLVCISHIWFQYTSLATPSIGIMNGYMQKILDLFDAYNTRQSGSVTMMSETQMYDFASCGGKVEFCIGGHVHIDLDLSSTGGIPVIITASDANQERSYDEDEDCGMIGTTTEAAVFGIVANYMDRKITVVGVGRGTSREISY